MSDIYLPMNVPNRGSTTERVLGKYLLKLFGWKIVGNIPNVHKAVAIVAPHTSNMDALYALSGLLATGIKGHIMAKHTVFRFPLTLVCKWLHFIPVERSAHYGLTQQLLQFFNAEEKFWLIVAPEGTRFAPKEWKSGFYRIAVAAEVPIVLVGLDYKQKEIHLMGTFQPTGNYARDLVEIQRHFVDMAPYHADRLSYPLRNIAKHSSSVRPVTPSRKEKV